jgi:UDP-N-acetylglucosamine 2-epimerase
VNIGARQRGREEAGDCIVHCGESQTAIRKAIRSALRKRPILGRSTTYGDGTAGRRIAEILASKFDFRTFLEPFFVRHT